MVDKREHYKIAQKNRTVKVVILYVHGFMMTLTAAFVHVHFEFFGMGWSGGIGVIGGDFSVVSIVRCILIEYKIYSMKNMSMKMCMLLYAVL